MRFMTVLSHRVQVGCADAEHAAGIHHAAARPQVGAACGREELHAAVYRGIGQPAGSSEPAADTAAKSPSAKIAVACNWPG